MTLRLSRPSIKKAPGRRLRLGLSLLGVVLSVGNSGAAGAQGSPPRATGVKRWERSLASGPAWTVYAPEPSGAASRTVLGQAQPVCLNEHTPEGCPRGAIRYGVPLTSNAWQADISQLGGAVWVWGPKTTRTQAADLTRLVFVRAFDLPRGARGHLQIAVDDFAEVRVNGTRIGSVGSIQDVSVAAAAQAALATFDLTPYLVEGKNTVGITAQNGPASFAACGGRCGYGQNPAGVVFGGRFVVCPDGGEGCGSPEPEQTLEGADRRRGGTVCSSAAGALGHDLDAAAQGDWSFGWSTTLSSPFTPYTETNHSLPPITDTEGLTWLTPADATHPVAFINPTKTVRYPSGTFSIQPGQMALHPGPGGELSIARWRAVNAGRISVEVEFFGLSGRGGEPLNTKVPTTTDVHVLRNGFSLAAGYVNLNGAGNAFRFRATIDVAPGEVIDFAVGYGNRSYAYDSTAVDAVICQMAR